MKYRKHVNGQLAPLEDRMSKANRDRRALKAAMRHKLMMMQQGQINAIAMVLRRSLFGKLKWLLLGR
jgi:hypothetical protein